MWSRGDWIKTLILFFDGIALLVPRYMKERPEQIDPAIVAGLKEHGLLEIIEPEKAVDKAATEKLALAITDVIASGVLDCLAKEDTDFHEISMSRLGYFGDQTLARKILDQLKVRGLATDSKDTVSIPMHPKVRSLILVLLSQILRPYGKNIDANLSPVTDKLNMVKALAELMAVKTVSSPGDVIEFDLNTVTVDLGPIPIDEVLSFRAAHLEAHKRYSLSVRKFAMELSRMSEDERQIVFEVRQAELNDLASDLRNRARKAWKKPSSFALTLIGGALSLVASPIAAVLSLGAAAVGYEKSIGIDVGAYSYLFDAHDRFTSF